MARVELEIAGNQSQKRKITSSVTCGNIQRKITRFSSGCVSSRITGNTSTWITNHSSTYSSRQRFCARLIWYAYMCKSRINNNYRYITVIIFPATVPPPASPSPPSMSAISIASSSSSPQSPGHFFMHHQSNHFIFNTSTINMISATTCLPLPGGSPSAIPTPSSPNNIPPSQLPPPLPPRSKRRENSCSESPQQVRI